MTTINPLDQPVRVPSWTLTDDIQWHEWAEKKAKTHRQERCPDCGLWAVW